MSARQTSNSLIFARNLVGMALVALANPLIWHPHSVPLLQWLSTWMVPLLVAGVAFGLFALFFTRRAKAAWPGKFFMLAWVLLAQIISAPWIETYYRDRGLAMGTEAQRAVPVQAPSPTVQTPAPSVPASDTDEEWWKKGATRVN